MTSWIQVRVPSGESTLAVSIEDEDPGVRLEVRGGHGKSMEDFMEDGSIDRHTSIVIIL